MSHNPISIENGRLLIHGLQRRDLDSLSAMRRDRLVYRCEPVYLTELQGSPETALESLRTMDLYKDRQCIMGVYEKTDPEALVGLAELYDFKPSGKVISIGYRFRSEKWGKGIGTCCVQALLDFIEHKTEVELVTAHVLPENQASARCLLKNGFEYLLTKKDDWGYDRESVADVYTYDCLRPNGQGRRVSRTTKAPAC
ncbi:MAG: GNAT family N-acetyltransferase [Clostridia bacterium]|nr:GNAT family N-acetyltransferase [Clostridia bacterium]